MILITVLTMKLYIWRTKTSTQNLACSQRQSRFSLTCDIYIYLYESFCFGHTDTTRKGQKYGHNFGRRSRRIDKLAHGDGMADKQVQRRIDRQAQRRNDRHVYTARE